MPPAFIGVVVGLGVLLLIWVLVSQGRRSEIPVVPRYSVDSQKLALSLAEAGLAVTRVNTFAARGALDRGRLVEVFPEARRTEGVWAVMPATRAARPVVREFITCLLEVTAELNVWDS